MKILIAGDWHSALHEEPMFRALRSLGHDVHRFSWHEYFQTAPGLRYAVTRLWRRVENRFLVGPELKRINRDLVALAERIDPELVFIYRGTHIHSSTLDRLRRKLLRAVIVGYNNDDPFSPLYPRWLWRHFRRSIPHYDLVLAYRHANLADLRAAGARRVELLRSWFVPEHHHPVAEDDAHSLDPYRTEVVFIGHYENDGRLECLEAIAAAGIPLRIFGPGYDWDPVLRNSPGLRHLGPVHLVWGPDYTRALCGAKIALCFLSTLNRDTYTRRCFEIPATGTFMLAQNSADLATLFREGEEAELFRSPEELVAKIERYRAQDETRRAVARAGLERVRRDGHDVVSRMRTLLQWVERVRSERTVATPAGGAAGWCARAASPGSSS